MLVLILDWKRQIGIGKLQELLLLAFQRSASCFAIVAHHLIRKEADSVLKQVKDEAWWLVLANTSSSQLYAIKRVSFTDFLVTNMDIPSNVNDFKVKAGFSPHHNHRTIRI